MFLIIQTGDPVTPALNQFGRFDQWFTTAMELTHEQVQVVNVHRGAPLPNDPEAANYTGIIITGSPAMVTDGDEWLLSTQNWLEGTFKNRIPTLGVCFGHQLLVDLLGGEVGYNPNGRNLGLSEFTLQAAADQDALLGHLKPASTIDTYASHLQSVKKLPASAVRLGHCDLDKNHAFRSDDFIWGLQFHPEWNAAITATYIEARHEDLLAEGRKPEHMKQALKACPDAYDLLPRFRDLAKSFN
ncbi:glutamine amidotransferase [Marinicella sp. S1101]|uniref:glutamine amidotransferase n=1 Tax=Marinicella marina TaxID=2996016 RepID=UPI002260B9CA|nr:glutamine amidotransferase [Marinicella marina]MCX7552315.1 glutamine amidotransferase [Marinicella marina]MDJ1139190.1 glutamine amidotransferase [Marinicella marina]